MWIIPVVCVVCAVAIGIIFPLGFPKDE